MFYMLTEKQTAFIKEFALTGNATQSVIVWTVGDRSMVIGS